MTYLGNNMTRALCLAAVSSAAAVSAHAGGVRITAINPPRRQSVSLPFAVTCLSSDGSESQPTSYSIWTGNSMVVNGCNKFVIYFTARGGRRFDYEMIAGHSYYFQWNGSLWAFNEYE
jgi:hypothetical protein